MALRQKRRALRVLVVDVGGTHVKVKEPNRRRFVTIKSGPNMTPRKMVRRVLRVVRGHYDAVSIGYPGPVLRGQPATDPKHLGRGWVGFNYGKAFGAPVKIINDAAMQALGSYRGKRLLFLGLGTGLGSALVVNGEVQALELGHLPYRKGGTFEEFVGKRGLIRGRKKWRGAVNDVVRRLRHAMQVDTVVLGGGNVKHLNRLPAGVRRGSNRSAIVGGLMLWRPGS